MSQRKKTTITLQKYTFSPADEEKLLEQSISDWQAQGVEAIWRATWELSLMSYALRGEDISEKRMDKSVFLKKTAPWLVSKSKNFSTQQEFDLEFDS